MTPLKKGMSETNIGLTSQMSQVRIQYRPSEKPSVSREELYFLLTLPFNHR
jgi:hypothetical protein